MQESVDGIVFPPGEPLRVLLDACLKEEGGMMMCNVDADSWLDQVHILPNELPEICFAVLGRKANLKESLESKELATWGYKY